MTDLAQTQNRSFSSGTLSRILAWGLTLSALVVGFAQNFAEMWIRWFPAWKRSGLTLYERVIGSESYYTHGPLVPVVSLLILLLLVKYTKIPVKPSPALGFTVLGIFLLGHLMASFARVNFASGFALIGVLAGMVILLWGTEAMRRLWFPLAFLFFMVPLPEVSIGSLNFTLKQFAAGVGFRIANLLGVIVERKGNVVYLLGGRASDALSLKNPDVLGDKGLVIANVCNGLRTLITVIAFGALYSFVCQLRGRWRLFLFAMSVPVAVVANSIRIVSLIVVADIWDVKVATGWFHDISGAAIFVLAFLMMFGIERAILGWLERRGRDVSQRALFKDVRRGPEDEHQVDRLAARGNSKSGWVLAIVLSFCALGAVWINRTVPNRWTGNIVENAIPEKLEIDGDTWIGTHAEFDEKTLDILETDDYFSRIYRTVSQPQVAFSVIFSRDNRKGTHPPEVCLEGGGHEIASKEAVIVDNVEGRGTVKCRGIVVHYPGGATYFLYVYKCGDAYTISFWYQQWIILWNGVLNRDSSGALIQASTLILNNDIEGARRRAKAFMRTCLPHLEAKLP